MFDYDAVLGSIDLENDSDAVQQYKAGAGALRYALTAGGWSGEQVYNGMLTHFESIAAVLAEHQRNWADTFGDTPTQQTIKSVVGETADRIDPRCNPCCRSHCTVCHPEETR